MMTLQVLQEEELLSVIDKIVTAHQTEIRLVVPNGARILESLENFSLIKREAESAGKTISVSTLDPRARSFAQAAGLPVFAIALEPYDENVLHSFRPRMSDILPPSSGESLQMPQEADTRNIPHYRTIQHQEPQEAVSAVEIVSVQEKNAAPFVPAMVASEKNIETPAHQGGRVFASGGLFKKNQSLPILIVGAGVIGALFIGYIIFFSPRAELVITPRSDDVASSFSFTAAINPGPDDISAQLVEIEKAAVSEIPASGSATVEEKAKGTVTIFNAYSSTQQTLVDTTRLVSQDGKLFRTTATVVVPGATIDNGEISPSSIDVPVIADQAGPDYNVGPSTFSIPGFQGTPKYTKFFGRSSGSMSGGAKGTVKVVTADDVKKAEDAAAKDALSQGQHDFSAKIPDSFKLLDNAKFTNQETLSNHQADDKADSVAATSKIHILALLFREEDVTARINVLLQKQFSANVEAIADTTQISYSVPNLDLDKGKMKLEVKVNEKVAWKIDTADIKTAVAGKSESEIKDIIRGRSDIASGTVTFRPAWADKAPLEPSRISIKLLSGQ